MRRKPFSRAERGAVLPEAAIMTPLVLMLFLGIIDAGLLFGGHLSAAWATKSAARAASAAGANALSDYDALQAVGQASALFNEGDIERIVIFHAADHESKPSEQCLTGAGVKGTGVGSCNVYTGSDLKRTPEEFGPDGWVADDNWPGATRQVKQSKGTDYVGVYVRVNCMCFAGTFKDLQTIERTSVVRLEPRTR